MEQYWKKHLQSRTPSPAANNPLSDEDSTFETEFDRHRQKLIAASAKNEGWAAELRRYLKDIAANVTKDTDIVQWWAVSRNGLFLLQH
jgi:hypothetical protein